MKTKVKYLTQKDIERELRSYIDLCFSLLDEHDNKEICNMTGLSLSTIVRYQSGNFTTYGRWETIRRIGIAAGLLLVWHEERIVLKLTK